MGSRKDLGIDFSRPEAPSILPPSDLSIASRGSHDMADLLKLMREFTESNDDLPLDETVADVRSHYHGLN
jgi:hypothetical protein